MNQYPTDLTDKQWQVTENILDPQHRKRKYPLRDIMMPVGLYFSYRFIHSPPFQQELVKASFLWLSEGISGGDASANQDTALV